VVDLVDILSGWVLMVAVEVAVVIVLHFQVEQNFQYLEDQHLSL
jgi:hypothetical protein